MLSRQLTCRSQVRKAMSCSMRAMSAERERGLGLSPVILNKVSNLADPPDHALLVGRPCKERLCGPWALCIIYSVSSAWSVVLLYGSARA